jgi:hypothetical protein
LASLSSTSVLARVVMTSLSDQINTCHVDKSVKQQAMLFHTRKPPFCTDKPTPLLICKTLCYCLSFYFWTSIHSWMSAANPS